MNRLIVLGVGVVVLLYVLFSSIYVVNVREQAIVMRFGRITEVHSEPGLYFKIPTSFIDSVQIIEDRLLRYDVANLTVQVKGGKFYVESPVRRGSPERRPIGLQARHRLPGSERSVDLDRCPLDISER